MLRLRWVRTILAAVGFAWLMVQWNLTSLRDHAGEVRLSELIAIECSQKADPDACELLLRLESRANALQVRGSVDVNGSVDVQ